MRRRPCRKRPFRRPAKPDRRHLHGRRRQQCHDLRPHGRRPRIRRRRPFCVGSAGHRFGRPSLIGIAYVEHRRRDRAAIRSTTPTKTTAASATSAISASSPSKHDAHGRRADRGRGLGAQHDHDRELRYPASRRAASSSNTPTPTISGNTLTGVGDVDTAQNAHRDPGIDRHGLQQHHHCHRLHARH